MQDGYFSRPATVRVTRVARTVGRRSGILTSVHSPIAFCSRRAVNQMLAASLALLVVLVGCSGSGNPKVPAGARSSGGSHGLIETDKGTIEIEFLPDAPKATENFRLLAEHRYYDGLTFHRIVK